MARDVRPSTNPTAQAAPQQASAQATPQAPRMPATKPGALARVLPVYAGCPLGVTAGDREPDGYIVVFTDSAAALEACKAINDAQE